MSETICQNPACTIPWIHEHVGTEVLHRVPPGNPFDMLAITDDELFAKLIEIAGMPIGDRGYDEQRHVAEAARRWMEARS